MFVLNHAKSLFENRYLLIKDERRNGYWAIYKKTISWIPNPLYEFNWPTISENEFRRRFPKHYDNYLWHKFLVEETNDEMDVNR